MINPSGSPSRFATPSVSVFLLTLLATTLATDARTSILDASDCNQLAGIAEAAPRHSWAMHERWPGVFTTDKIALAPQRSFLFRFSLDKIPPGQRISHAQLTLPVTQRYGAQPRFYLWRITAGWGPGVCYRYRSATPKPVKWTKPGAAGLSSDRATRPTDIVRLIENGDVTINVTEDVEIWHSGAAKNNGWLLSIEDPGINVDVRSPLTGRSSGWKLRITYEPE